MIDYDLQEKSRYEKSIALLERRAGYELSHPESYKEAYTEDFRKEALRMGILIEIPSGLKSIANLLKTFLITKKFEGCTSSTLNGYYNILYQFLYSLEKSPLEADASDIRSYLIKYQDIHSCSNRTLDNMRLVFSSFYNWLENESYIVKNPLKKIKRIKYDRVILQPFTDEELESLRGACHTYRELAIIEFLYSTGCRVSEVCAIDKTDINFTYRETVIFGKGKRERVVYFNAKAKLYILKYLSSRQDNNQALFVTNRYPYRRMERSGIEFICKKIGDKAGIEHCHPHRFRRTLATNLIDKGVPIEQVQTLLGHSKLDTTLLYANVNQSNVKTNHNKHV